MRAERSVDIMFEVFRPTASSVTVDAIAARPVPMKSIARHRRGQDASHSASTTPPQICGETTSYVVNKTLSPDSVEIPAGWCVGIYMFEPGCALIETSRQKMAAVGIRNARQ